MIVRDYAIARRSMHANLKVKFNWLNQMPWLLAALYHHDQDLARQTLAPQLHDYGAQPEAQRALRHRRVHAVCCGRSAWPVRAVADWRWAAGPS